MDKTLNMDKIPGSVGYQILNEEGAILSSSGQLEYDETTANRIFKFLHTACKIPLSEKKDYWKRIMVLWDDFIYIIFKDANMDPFLDCLDLTGHLDVMVKEQFTRVS